MSPLNGFLGKLFKRDRRKSDRLTASELAAYFWTGAAPVEHQVRDISSTGLYLLTEERWYPGTLVMMTLQKKDLPEEASERTIAVLTKVVRLGDDGVGLEFVLAEAKDGRHLPQEGANRRALDQFLKTFKAGHGSAFVTQTTPPE